MSLSECTRCGSPHQRSFGVRTDGTGTGLCSDCARARNERVQADPVWAEGFVADLDARNQQDNDREAEPDLERRVSAEIDLDPLTSATLIVAEEDKRISE